MLELLKKLSQSKWISTKLAATGGVDAALIQQMVSSSSDEMKIVCAVCMAFVTAIYALATAIQNAMTKTVVKKIETPVTGTVARQ